MKPKVAFFPSWAVASPKKDGSWPAPHILLTPNAMRPSLGVASGATAASRAVGAASQGCLHAAKADALLRPWSMVVYWCVMKYAVEGCLLYRYLMNF